MSNVKFKKERLENARYEGSVEVRWWFKEGTKYLPAVYAIKECYGWEIYDADGDCYTRGLDYYSRLRTKADAKAYIEGYDEMIENTKAIEAEEEARIIKEYEDRIALEKGYLENFLAPNKGIEVKAGDFIEVVSCGVSKVDNVGEGLKYVRESSYSVNAKIVKVIEVNEEEYERFARRTLSNDEIFEYYKNEDGSYAGGCESEDPRLDNVENFFEISNDPELKEIFMDTRFEILNAIVCEGRNNIYVNTEGYGYARYLAFDFNSFTKATFSGKLELVA